MMINPPKAPEDPKPTRAQFTNLFQDPSPGPSSQPLTAHRPLPHPQRSHSIQATASSQDPLLLSNFSLATPSCGSYPDIAQV